MTLCYLAWRITKEVKTLAGRYSVAVLFALPPDKVFCAADKAAVSSHLSSGTELRSRGISEYLPAMCQAGAGSPGVIAAHPLHPTTPYKLMHVPFKESGGASPTSKSTTNHLLIVYWSLSDIYIA